MKKIKSILHKRKSFLLIFLFLGLLTALFTPNSFKGKVPVQSDIVQFKGAASEATAYYKNNDERILWTNSLFGGMPTYVINNPGGRTIIKHLKLPSKPRIWAQLFLYTFCAFIMLISFKVRPWLAVIGAIAIGFATENFTILAVGHNTKAAAIGYLPLVLAGCQFLFRKKWLLGLTVLSAGFALQIYVNHVQITYYGSFMVVLFFVFQLAKHYKEKSLKDYAMAACLALLGAGIALGANSLNLLMLQEYATESIRGKSALTMTKGDEVKSDNGLSKDYTFSYSNGWTDIGATIIPNYSGGDSDKLGLYYGQIGSTSGPKYIGATIFILMILGLVLVKGPQKWWLITVMLLTLVLSMGGNHFTSINTFMYEHFPLYNKFRAPSMMMVLVQISSGLLAILGLEQLFRNSKLAKEEFKKLKIAGISGIAILVLLTFTGTMLNDFSSTPQEDENGQVVYDADTRYAQSVIQRQGAEANTANINRFKEQLVEMRIDAMKKDGSRSLFFALAVLLVVWLAYKSKIEQKYVIVLLGLLITADLWFVGKRYLNDKDFKKARTLSQPFQPYAVDLEIQEDQSYYRVLDLTQSTLNSNRCAYFHKSIGGYSAAKIRRFQDLWDWHLIEDLGKGNIMDNGILNMLNMKYFIYPNQQQQGAAPRYGINPKALGNAWFIDQMSVVKNADSAILALKKINTSTTGFVEEEHKKLISMNQRVDSSATVELLTYHPEKLEYKYNSTEESNIAFSEVYYDKGWNAYIDDKLVDHFRMNYIIRGLKVPAGEHTITFKFEPKTYQLGSMLSKGFGVVVYLLIGMTLFVWIRKEFFSQMPEPQS